MESQNVVQGIKSRKEKKKKKKKKKKGGSKTAAETGTLTEKYKRGRPISAPQPIQKWNAPEDLILDTPHQTGQGVKKRYPMW